MDPIRASLEDRVFDHAYNITLKHEGVYSDNAFDSGGQTYYGIARNFWPRWPGWVEVDKQIRMYGRPKPLVPGSALEFDVREFYRTNFWIGPKYHLLASVFDALAIEVFDSGVNMGVHRSALILQCSLNILNRRGTLWPDIREDGGIGTETMSAVVSALQKRGRDKLYQRVNYYQAKIYIDLMRGNPEKYEEFDGWFNRISVDYREVIKGL